MLRLVEWKRGMRMRCGKRRGEKTTDVAAMPQGRYFICRRSHRATFRTHPLSPRGRHFWRMLPLPKMIFDNFSEEGERLYAQMLQREAEEMAATNNPLNNIKV